MHMARRAVQLARPPREEPLIWISGAGAPAVSKHRRGKPAWLIRGCADCTPGLCRLHAGAVQLARRAVQIARHSGISGFGPPEPEPRLCSLHAEGSNPRSAIACGGSGLILGGMGPELD